MPRKSDNPVLPAVSAKPGWSTKRQVRLLRKNVERYFKRVIRDNTLPLLDDERPVSLEQKAARDRVRKTMRAILEEGNLIDRPPHEVENYLDAIIAEHHSADRPNPYRQSVLILMSLLNAAVMVDYYATLYPDHKGFTRDLTRIKPLVINGLHHIYGKKPGIAITTGFPAIAGWWKAS